MFGLSNVPRNCFLEKVFGENYITAQLSPQSQTALVDLPGLLVKASSSDAASCNPSTSLAYSSCSLEASVFLILNNQ